MACQVETYKTMLSEFIDLYRSMPCLWKVTSKEYTDRNKKDRAYDVLANKLKQVDPTSNRYKVVKKINNMRTSFRKELKKYLKSKETETNPEDVYRPRLWYFDSLLFLVETDEEGEKEEGKSTTLFLNEGDGNQEWEEVKSDESPSNPVELQYFENIKDEQLSDEADSQQDPFALMKVSVPYTEAFHSNQQEEDVKRNNYHDHQPEYATMNIKSENSLTEDDECDLIGKHVAAKLRKLNPIDALIAEKRINDILFDIQLKHLRSQSQNSHDVNTNEF